MRIILTDHARARIRERNINLKHVYAALASPDVLKPSSGNTIYVRKQISIRRAIIVIYKEYRTADRFISILITSYYHSSP